MEVILSIIALVAGVSLYDYFSVRRWQQVTSDVRNNIVFENRNQEYGAYVLRRDYDKYLVLIMAGLVLSIGLVYGGYVVIKNLPEAVVEKPPVDTSQFTVAAPPVDEELPPPPKEEPLPPMEKTVAFTPPVVVDVEVDDEIPIQEDMDDKKSSTVNNDQENENFEVPVGPTTPQVVEQKQPEIMTFVDEEAEFPGGYAAMMAYIQKKVVYPQIAVERGITGKVFLKFVVNADGEISRVTVERGVADCPECDKEAQRVVRGMPKWKAGKNNGSAVASYFTLPINFTLE
jgi:protein TonB